MWLSSSFRIALAFVAVGLAPGSDAGAQALSGAKRAVALPGQGLRAELPVSSFRRWKAVPRVSGDASSTTLSLVDNTMKPVGANFELAIAPLGGCAGFTGNRGGKVPTSSTRAAGYQVHWYESAGQPTTELLACQSVTLGGRSQVSLVVAGQVLRTLPSGRAAVAEVLGAFRDAATLGKLVALRPMKSFRQSYAGALPRLKAGRRTPIREDHGQFWKTKSQFTSSATYQQVSPFVGLVTVKLSKKSRPGGCSGWLSTQQGRRGTTSSMPRGFAGRKYIANPGKVEICRQVGSQLVIASLQSPLDPERALKHAGPFVAAAGDAWAAAVSGSVARANPSMSGRMSASEEREARRQRLKEALARRRREKDRRNERDKKRRERELDAKKLIEAERNESGAGSPDKSIAIFGELGWRTWINPAGRVPEPVFADNENDDRSSFERQAQVWSVRGGAMVNGIYGAAGMETYYGGSRDGVTPRVLQFEVGFGGAGREWSEGGTGNVRQYSYENLDQYGNPCPKIEKSDSAEEARAKMRGIRCNKVRVTETNTPVQFGAAWLEGSYAFFGGWRHISDFLAGDSPDQSLPLVSGGGPVIGANAMFKRGILHGVFGHEFSYYLHGWDDHGKLGYSGNLAAGAAFVLADFRWRLDPGVGKEFSLGIKLRFDL